MFDLDIEAIVTYFWHKKPAERRGCFLENGNEHAGSEAAEIAAHDKGCHDRAVVSAGDGELSQNVDDDPGEPFEER